MPTLVFHGSGDTTVAPINAEQIISQWAQTTTALTTAPTTTASMTAPTPARPPPRRADAATHATYLDSVGRAVMEKYVIEGMAHAWSGNSSGSYTDARGPNQSAIVWAFSALILDLARCRRSMAAPRCRGQRWWGQRCRVPDHVRPDMSSPDMSSARHVLARHVLARHGKPRDDGDAVPLAAEDGTVGALPVDGVNAAPLKTGDKGLFSGDTYRGIPSFDTRRSLPAQRCAVPSWCCSASRRRGIRCR